MRFSIGLFFLVPAMIFSINAIGQEATVPNLIHNIDTAKANAAKTDQAILMVFAGSDWCRPCMKFKKDILTSPQFSEYAPSHLQVLYLDFPSKRANQLSESQVAHNEGLAEKYNREGSFPRIILFDANERLLGELKFTEQDPEVFISQVEQVLGHQNHQ